MGIADCIAKFSGTLDLQKLQSAAKAFEAEGMTPDTALVKAAKEEQARVAAELDDVHKIAGIKTEAKPDAAKMQKEAEKSVENATTDEVISQSARLAAKDDIESTRMLDEADMEYRQDELEAKLYNVAVQCVLGRGMA